jgi:hypothetical protein
VVISLGLFNQVVVFGLPGAFTPVCTSRHVPGYVDSADKFKAKGVDNVVCVYAFPSASPCSLSSQLWPHHLPRVSVCINERTGR